MIRALPLVLVASLTLGLLGPTSRAEAGWAERKFKGQVLLFKKRLPFRFRSQGAMVGWLRKNRVTKFWPDKDNKKQWSFKFMAFFRRPLNDLEVKFRVYDITEGKRFINGDQFYTSKRGETVFSSSLVLEKPPFAINRKYRIELINPRTRTLLASTKFWLRGKKETYSGRVNFSDEEAKLK